MRRPLELELLEPRVYLSAPAHDEQPRMLLWSGSESGFAQLGLPSVSETSAQAILLVVDVNGVSDPGDAILATFDPETGALLGSVPVSRGELILLTEPTTVPNAGGSTGIAPQSPAAVVTPPNTAPPSDTTPSSSTPLPGDTTPSDGSPAPTGDTTTDTGEPIENSSIDEVPSIRTPVGVVITDDSSPTGPVPTPGSSPPGNGTPPGNVPPNNASPPSGVGQPIGGPTAPSPTRPPIVVIFTNGSIPPSFIPPGNADRRPSVPLELPRGSTQPLILIPSFSRWLTALNDSPWWTRAAELPGVQSRVGDLMTNQNWDDTIGARPGLLSDDGSSGMASESGSLSSRVFLRSPVRSIVFTTPRIVTGTQAQPGAELAVYDMDTGQLRRTGHSVTGRLMRAGDQVAFLSSEWEQAADLTDDGVWDSLVLQMFNPVTGGVRNTGISAEAIRVDDDQLILGIRSPVRQSERGDHSLIAHRFDPRTGRLVDLQTGFESTAAAGLARRPSARLPLGHPQPVAKLLTGTELAGTTPISPLFVRAHTMAPIDTGESAKPSVASDLPARPASGGPSGPPRPGGSTGGGSGSLSTESESASAARASDSGASSAGGSE
jgi:hypothetical protein